MLVGYSWDRLKVRWYLSKEEKVEIFTSVNGKKIHWKNYSTVVE
jgi:hypothetical protein